MLKEFVNRLVELAAPTIHEVEGSVYSNQQLVHIMDKKPMPKCIDLTGLDSICKMVRNEAEHVGLQIFIQVKDYKSVSVFTELASTCWVTPLSEDVTLLSLLILDSSCNRYSVPLLGMYRLRSSMTAFS